MATFTHFHGTGQRDLVSFVSETLARGCIAVQQQQARFSRFLDERQSPWRKRLLGREADRGGGNAEN